MLKRLFDLVTSLLALLILLPVIGIIAVMISVQTPGPVFFVQTRIGKHGKPFKIYKFRTMVINHEGSTISIKGEQRITRLGAKLRRHKLDELPELWNVIKGDMSLVGPRPDMPEYFKKLKGDEIKILNLKPGITGPATLKYSQEEELLLGINDPVKYNDEVIWPDKTKINLEYYYNNNFFIDLKYLIKTLKKL